MDLHDSQYWFQVAINRAFLTLNNNDDDRYVGSYMFMGPSGDGRNVVFKHGATRQSFKMPINEEN